jgi:hypothetical protein
VKSIACRRSSPQSVSRAGPVTGRAAMLDEGPEVVIDPWSGQPVTRTGRCYQVAVGFFALRSRNLRKPDISNENLQQSRRRGSKAV